MRTTTEPPRKGMTTRELVLVVALIAVVAAAMSPIVHYAWQKRQERLNRELCAAARDARWDEAKRLLSRGADANAKDDLGATPLLWTARDGDEPVAQLLMASGADVNARDSEFAHTPLETAAWGGHKDVAEDCEHECCPEREATHDDEYPACRANCLD